MIVSFINSKGGTGKSSLSVNLAIWSQMQGFSTGVIDCDPQRSSSTWLTEIRPDIEVRVAGTPEECLSCVRGLSQTCDLVVGDGPAGIDEISRLLIIHSDLAVLPITPSILDFRSLQGAIEILKYAQKINKGRPEGRVVFNKFRMRDRISNELLKAAPRFGVRVAKTVIRDLAVCRDVAQQGETVFQIGKRGAKAAADLDRLFQELLGKQLTKSNFRSTKRRK